MNEKYSQLEAELKGQTLTVTYHRARYNPKDTEKIEISAIEPGSTVPLGVQSKSFYYVNKILLVEDIEDTSDVLVVYTQDGYVYAYRHNNVNSHPLTRFMTVRSKAFFVWLSRRSLQLAYVSCVINKYQLPVKEIRFSIGNEVERFKKIPVFSEGIKPIELLRRGVSYDRVLLKPLLQGEPQINSSISISVKIDDRYSDRTASHFLTRGTKLYTNRPKWYYAPITQTRRNGFNVNIRRNGHGGLSIVRRRLGDVENTLRFRFYESVLVSFILYHLAHTVRKLSRKKVNLYFEKLAGQAEEGAIDVFRKARNDSKFSKNYYIIRDMALIYESIKKEKGVVRNFTLHSYWLMYRANNVIATEVPQHMNILRSGNKYARRAPYTQTFVFLQHGITYLKPQDKTTSFKKGREGEPDYMIVNSKKERDIASDMLNIKEERLINSGMAIFDNTKYNHITAKSTDIVTIMLTWKPYEEHIQDFVESTYYKTTVQLYDSVSKLVKKENIRIIAHPKFKNHMLGTDMESVLWQGTVSDALEQTKLVITDYSSVCYNVFYQGGGVIFYQPDLDCYQQETGKLIPRDDEYIGERVFSSEHVDTLLGNVLKDGAVNLASLRSKRFVDNYKTINEYSDGKNIERIYTALHDLKLV